MTNGDNVAAGGDALKGDVADPPKGSVGLALGGGAARGLAHIPVLEALDELGIRPRIIAGTSIGSLIGGVYASGLSGSEIRDYVLKLFDSRSELIRRLITRWPGSVSSLFNPMTPAMFAPQTLFEILLPEMMAKTFEELAIPLKVVAADFYSQEQVIFTSGPLMPAISASSALPALLKPVEIDGRILIDGGFVNPTPFDLVRDDAAITVGVDVTGKPGGVRDPNKSRGMPNSLDAWIGAAQITLHSIISEKLKSQAPDILIRPEIDGYGAMDFYKVHDILAAAGPVREELKRALGEKLSAIG